MNISDHIRTVPDFPKPGILFYDISTLLANHLAYRAAVTQMAGLAEKYRPDVLVGIESRGFIFAAPLALHMDRGFVMVRKVGKLPGAVVSHDYDLEYGSDTVQIVEDLIPKGARAVLIDDLIATGGTAEASIQLLRKIGAEPVAAICLIELDGLGGRDRLSVPVETVLTYPG
ncbi:MAG TPA: adenine phosphoribosyltransferase [Geminicoccus sp.]|uniref:adenine phosphoribosyltransferase n=1 Tax=Geminicoccus sp. TaxID=2024832 RepID=UPI002CCB4761|nr:adenine phosphoribosyltransferase [Geminicoccus sp.]HWL68382.1 adenine phosphoribosyltransferase [Geminicoccus sp.]